MSKPKRISFPTKKLTEAGFVVAQDCHRKVAGVWEEWVHEDGRRAKIGYALFSRTHQSSIGSAADWGYTVTVTGRRHEPLPH